MTTESAAAARHGHERARKRRLLAAPIGRGAAAIYTLARELRDALADFVAEYPDAAAAESAAAAALGGRGPPGHRWCADHYSDVPGECRGWLFLLNLMGDLLENCADHDPKGTGLDEGEGG